MTAAVSSASMFIFLSRVASWRASLGPNGATSSPSSSSSLAIFSKPSRSTRNATAARHLPKPSVPQQSLGKRVDALLVLQG